MTLLNLIVWILIIGFVAWLISTAPFIEATFKAIIKWLLLVAVAFVVISFLVHALGGPELGGNLLRLW
jgi:hypothetical protein